MRARADYFRRLMRIFSSDSRPAFPSMASSRHRYRRRHTSGAPAPHRSRVLLYCRKTGRILVLPSPNAAKESARASSPAALEIRGCQEARISSFPSATVMIFNGAGDKKGLFGNIYRAEKSASTSAFSKLFLRCLLMLLTPLKDDGIFI